ncbi:MAG: hypothetical protein ABR543_09965 [Gemmatimonadaceae bacterium]
MYQVPRMFPTIAALILAATAIPARHAVHAQQTLTTVTSPNVGQMAPDFSLPGATRYGTLSTPVTIAQYRGKTIALSFFFQARTKG